MTVVITKLRTKLNCYSIPYGGRLVSPHHHVSNRFMLTRMGVHPCVELLNKDLYHECLQTTISLRAYYYRDQSNHLAFRMRYTFI